LGYTLPVGTRGLVGSLSQSSARRLLVAPSSAYLGLAAVLELWAGRRLDVAGQLLWLMAGFTAWTLGEYAGHRFVQHAPRSRRWAHLDDHAWHHRSPDDVRELVYSLAHSLPALPVVAAIAWLSTWSLAPAAAMCGGTLAGYVVYEWIHMGAHAPALFGGQRWLHRLSAHHLAHHAGPAHKNFGFVTPLWDHVFGTFERR
jgi:dihydroceramide fatty acyl 2-hydroxylase